MNFFKKLQLKLYKTRKIIHAGIKYLFSKKKIDKETLRIIEELLITSDVGVQTTNKIINSLTKDIYRNNINDVNIIYSRLKEKMYCILKNVEFSLQTKYYFPFVILVVGINGVGKTTTIGKLAERFKKEGKSVLLAAGDTFRSGAIEQLLSWGNITKVPVISQNLGSDPAAVIFDAFQSAKAKKIDIIIADTAGRLQNKIHLMNELKKIVTVIKKLDKKAPHEIMLVIDASTGQNAIQQIKLFNEYLGITGITITKLDGTAKGGVLFRIADEFSIPIRFIGIGETKNDLNTFQSSEFIKAIFYNKSELPINIKHF